jgi:hypothetical protein
MSSEPSNGPRASDEDRDQTAQLLREHFAVGRLTEQEMTDRVQAAYEASTTEQLAALTRDLPRLPATPQQQKAELIRRRGELQRRLLQQSGAGLALFVVGTVIWLVSGANGQFWPVWILLVTLVPLLRGGWSLYGPAPELDRVEAELEQRERKNQQREELRTAARSGALERRTRRRRLR